MAAAITTLERHVSLAKSLPAPLQRFFARNPPRQLLPSLTVAPCIISTDAAAEAPARVSPPVQNKLNPFMPHKNPSTGRWNPPIYSLRRQAELVKMARSHGVEDLLPYTKKGSEERTRRRLEEGLRIKGTGVGQRVKGHRWERTQKSRLEKRRQAMLGMPQLIQDWKQVRIPFSLYLTTPRLTIITERSWKRMEEVALQVVNLMSRLVYHRTVLYQQSRVLFVSRQQTAL